MGTVPDVDITAKPQQGGVLLVHLLDKCNLRCQHCYMNSAPERTRCLPAGMVIRCLQDTDQLGIRTVYLTGGEPFLHPELGTILSAVVPRQAFQLAVCTNGTLVGSGEAALLKAHGVAAQVSVDGPESYHDRFRGVKGAFQAASDGIQAFVLAGVPVTVVVTICRDNLGFLPWLAKWALRMGVERVSVQPLQEVGRGAAMGATRLSDEQMCDLFMHVSDLGHGYRDRGLRFSLNYRSRSYLLAHPCAAYVCDGLRCHRFVTKEIKTLVVREDGTVLPEIPSLNPRFALGSLYDSGLVELVRQYLAVGYEDFHRLCRTVFMEVMPTFGSPIVPWDELLCARSWTTAAGGSADSAGRDERMNGASDSEPARVPTLNSGTVAAHRRRDLCGGATEACATGVGMPDGHDRHGGP